MKARALTFGRGFVYFIFDVAGPTRRDVYRWAAERAASSKVAGVMIAVALTGAGYVFGRLFEIVALAGLLALSAWGEPRPGAVARWAFTAMVVYGIAQMVIVMVLLAIIGVILGIGALV